LFNVRYESYGDLSAELNYPFLLGYENCFSLKLRFFLKASILAVQLAVRGNKYELGQIQSPASSFQRFFWYATVTESMAVALLGEMMLDTLPVIME
jgi:hypothetical protein